MILFYFKDLILKSRIKETAGNQQISFARSVDEVKTLLQSTEYTVFIADLSSGAKLASDIQPALRDDLQSIAVISHVDTDTHQAALDSGFKIVMPRSRFVNELPALLQHHSQVK